MLKKIMTGCLIALTLMVTCGSPVYCVEQLTEGALQEGTVTSKTNPPVQAFDEEALTEKPNIDWEYAVGREMFKNRFSDLEILSEEEEIVQEYLKYLVLEEQKLYPEGVPDGVSYGIPDWGHDVSTGLHRFCERLPKGGDLHVHEYT